MNNDLISREALKKSLEELKKSPWYCEHRDTIDGIASHQAQKEALQIVENIINNAPTAVDVKGAELAYNNGYKHAKEKYKRPQGKWIYHKAVDYFLPCMECNNCHEEFLLNDLTPAYFKKVKHFCSNCGADMRKGGAE